MRALRKLSFWFMLILIAVIGTTVYTKTTECNKSCASHDCGSFDFVEWRCYCVDKTPLNFYHKK